MAEEKDVPTNLILQLADGRYAKLPDDQLESFVIPDEEVEALLRESGREAAFPEAARMVPGTLVSVPAGLLHGIAAP